MTRLLCFADLHIGAGADLSSERLADQERTLDQIVDLVISENVDTVLIAGDVFHRPRPTPEQLLVFSRFTRALERGGVPVLAITGNAGHDIENGDRPCALELFASDWFRVSRSPEMVKVAGDVAVCTLPSVPVSRLVAAQGGGDRGETFELAATLLMETAAELRGQVPDGWPSILMGHWSVSGAALPNGMPVADLNETVLPLDVLIHLGFDSCVFGHIHRNQALTALGSPRPIFYTGSPHVVDFGEASVWHGVCVIDTEDFASTLMLPLEDRRFVTLDTDLINSEDLAAENIDETDLIAIGITEQIPRGLEGAVVRLRYRATEEQHRRVDRQALLNFLADAGADKVHGPTWELVRTARARVEVADSDGMTDQQALALWCDANAIDGSDRTSLLELLDDGLPVAA